MTNILLGKFAAITNLGLILLLIPIVLAFQNNIYAILIGMSLPCIHYYLWGMEEDKQPISREVKS